MKRNWIRLTVFVQIFFFGGWAVFEEMRRFDAPEVLLETMPVDPRDILSGHYMQLRLKISNVKCVDRRGRSSRSRKAETVGVLLVPVLQETSKGRFYVWQASECRVPAPPISVWQRSTRGLWVRGRRGPRGVVFGIERYYFSEERKEELNSIRSGQFYVKAVVGRDGRLALKDLVFDPLP